jgi:hypothetical protein
MNRDIGPKSDRRDFLKSAGLGVAGAFAGGANHGSWSVTSAAAAQTVQAPRLSDQKWWPSKWGAGDEAGSTNHLHATEGSRNSQIHKGWQDL